MEFKTFKHAVAKQFERMKGHQLYRVDADKNSLWDTYLGSFPPGTNPIYRQRTEHDCNCCKSFIRTMGGVVAIIDGKIETIWDGAVGEPNYQAVSTAMASLVRSHVIVDQFLHFEKTAGTDKSFDADKLSGAGSWDHFFVNIPAAYVRKGADIASELGKIRSSRDVFFRSLNEIDPGAVSTVLELIAQNSIYRGAEHKFAVESFQKLQKEFKKLDSLNACRLFAWEKLKGTPESVLRIRNTSIGTLLNDLTEGKDLEDAVKAFEAMVAPANYKRPTALVTKAMVEKAKKTIEELGLTPSLERRYATIDDITINNVLFANRDARRTMEKDVFDDIAGTVAVKTPKLDKVEEVPIEKFLADILPRASSIELMVEGRHTSNLVTLIAPVDPVAPTLFKWDNRFSWSYNGDVADSVKERVKKAGGNVTGDLCCRLGWFNHDDLDLHMMQPDGVEIYFARKGHPGGGMLDVDMNAGGGTTREPVENIFYADRSRMKEGVYRLFVNCWAKRESKDVGFEVEFDFMGEVRRFEYPQAMKQSQSVTVVTFRYSRAKGIEIIDSLPASATAKKSVKVWGIDTQNFHKVSVAMLSPNHWDGHGVGNKHYMFMLEGCANEGQARGFFNEFLKEELTPHRKVIEMVGAKMRTEQSDKQLSGLGFSSTQRNDVLCRVTGAFSRIIKIVF